MARLDWDRLRRTRPLDGADARVDADGAWLWEQPRDDASVPLGSRRLRRGVIVRRRQERANAAAAAENGGDAAPEPPAARQHRSGPMRCSRCGARVSPRKLLRHARRCPSRP